MNPRSICIVSRRYPSPAGRREVALAHGLSALGFVVHVITADRTRYARLAPVNGVLVHRLPDSESPDEVGPAVSSLRWAERAAGFYRDLDGQVGFDLVLAPEADAESSLLVTGPHTRLVVMLDAPGALVDEGGFVARVDPARHLAHRLELESLARADMVIASTRRVHEATRRLVAHEARVLPIALDGHRPQRAPIEPTGEPRLVVLGGPPDEPRALVALDTLLALRARHARARLTFVATRVPSTSRPPALERAALRALAADHGVEPEAVTVLDHAGPDALAALVAGALAALAPDGHLGLDDDELDALASGVPVFVPERSGLCEWLGEADGVTTYDPEAPGALATAVVDRLATPSWRATVGARAPRAITEAFSPRVAAERVAELADELCPPRPRRVLADGPRLAAVLVASGGRSTTERAVHSILRHTHTPFELLVLDDATDDGTSDWLAGLDDPRLRVVRQAEPIGVLAARNLGLRHLRGDEELVAFLDDDVEVFADWWRPFANSLLGDARASIAAEDGSDPGHARGEAGSPYVRPAPFCVVARPDALRRIGDLEPRFGPQLALAYASYASRAARLGERVAVVGSRRVVHHGTCAPHEAPLELADSAVAPPASRFLVVADVEEALSVPGLLSSYAGAFTADDEALLLLVGRCTGDARDAVVAELERTLSAAGVDLEVGPKVEVALLADLAPSEVYRIATRAHCILTDGHPPTGLAHLGRVGPDSPGALRDLAARAWRASAPRVA